MFVRLTCDSFGDPGPWETESFESFADEMMDSFKRSAIEEWPDGANDDETKEEFIDRFSLELREKFINSLEEVKNDAQITVDIDDVKNYGSLTQAIKERGREEGFFLPLDKSELYDEGASVDIRAVCTVRRYCHECEPEDIFIIDPKTGISGTGTGDKEDLDSIGIEWDKHSCVELEVPDFEDVIQYPDHFIAMANAVFQYHSACSDMDEWRNMVKTIRDIAEETKEIEL